MKVGLRVVHLKLIRAEEHLHSLKREIALFREIQPYEVVEDRDSDETAVWITIRARHWPQAQWSIIMGDFIHNLRSALDILANQLVRLADNEPITTGASSDKTQFPILNKRPKLKGGIEGRAEIRGGVSEDAAAIVDAVQPYTWDNPTMHPLAIIREMSNKDKHRGPNVMLSFLPGVESSFDTGDLEALLRQFHPVPVVTEKTFPIPYRGRVTKDVKMNLHFSPLVLASEPWEGEDADGDAIAFASYLFKFVCQKVVAPIRRVCWPDHPPLHLADPFPPTKKYRKQPGN